MATITLGNSYRFKDYNNNKYLNILVNGNPANNSNVTIYSLDSADMGQVWKCDHHSGANVSGVLMKSAKDTSFALDRWRGSSNYNNADVYKIGTTDADLQDQLVEFLPISNGYYRIKLVYADLYLTVSATTAYGGYNVNWQAITGNADQLWAAELYSVSSSATPEPTPTAIKDKEFFVKAYGTNLNLNVYGTDTVANARNVNAYEKEDCLAQRWIAKQTSAGPKLFTKINQSYALNINTADNNCTMYTAAGNDNDSVLEFEEAGDMLYRIKMFKYGKYLTVNGSTSGSNVIWSDYVTTATLWEFIPEDVMFPSAPKAPDAPEGIVGNTYAVQANGTDFYLNVYGTDTVADGRNVNIYNKDDCLAQRWFIKNTDNGPKLFTKVNEEVGYTLNIYTTDDNCTMYTDSTENDADSILEFISVGNMLYRIKMYHHDKYLCIDGAATSGANVKWISGASSTTVWKLVPEATAFPTPASAPATIVGKTFFIKNYNTGYNLNVHGTNTVALGRNVNVFAKEPEDSQRWQVIQTPKGPKIITEINPDFALNIHVENNNNCVMYDIDDNNADSIIEFVPYDEDKNIYKLKMFHHNKYLDVAGVGSGFNAYWSESPNGYTLWQFVEEDDMFPPVEDAPADIADKVFFIQNVNTGHFLNVHGTDTVANTRNVNVYAKENANAQRWIIRNKNGGPKLVTKIDETFAVNIYANDNNCTMYKEDGNDIDSVLQFIPYTTGQTAAEDDVYRIKMHYHNRYLTVSNTNIGANAWWTSVDSEPYALWKLIPESEMTFDSVTDTDTTPDSSLVSVFMPAHSNNYMVGRAGNQISEITIHHTAAVASSVERIGDDWQNPERGASSHYCVRGTRVGQFVKECNTAYTNGGSLKNPDAGNPNVKAVTIETCNSTGDPTWEVSDDTYYTLVRLVADIARRNNLGTLVVGQNLKTHQDHAYTICPGPYILARMQDIADRANEINAAYITGRVYLRKHNTDKFFSVDENNHVVLVDKDNAKPWLLENNNGKTNICDFNNPHLKMNVDTDETTLILAEGESEVYADFLNEKTFDICYEVSDVSGLSRTGNTIRKTYDSTDNSAGLKANANCDHVDEVADVNEEIPNVTSEMPEVLKNRVVKIKHKASGKYLTYCEDGGTNTNGYGETAKLIEKVNDNSDLSQIWKITQYGDDMYCLTTYAEANYSLDFAADNNICVAADSGWYVPNRRTISIVKVENTENEYKIKFPSIGKNCVRHITLEGETDIICVSSVDNDNAIWILEEPEAVVVNTWMKLFYNPQPGYGFEKKYISIPNYAFRANLGDIQVIDGVKTVQTIDKNGKSTNIEVESIDGVDCHYITAFKQRDNSTPENTVWYRFADSNFWYSKEDPYKDEYKHLNEHAYNKIIERDYDNFDINEYIQKGSCGEYTDGNDYYWVAIGPNVIYPNYPENREPGTDGTNFYEIGTIDAVLMNENKVPLYLHCRVGDIKGHSWNNGVIQTWYPFANTLPLPDESFDTYFKKEENPEGYNGQVCIEFIGTFVENALNIPSTNIGEYAIDNIIFYPNEYYTELTFEN